MGQLAGPPVLVTRIPGDRHVWFGIVGGASRAKLRPDQARQLAGDILSLVGPKADENGDSWSGTT